MSKKEIRFHIYAIWVLDYKTELIMRRSMNHMRDDHQREMHANIISKKFSQDENIDLQIVLKELYMIKLMIASLTGVVVGFLLHLLITC